MRKLALGLCKAMLFVAVAFGGTGHLSGAVLAQDGAKIKALKAELIAWTKKLEGKEYSGTTEAELDGELDKLRVAVNEIGKRTPGVFIKKRSEELGKWLGDASISFRSEVPGAIFDLADQILEAGKAYPTRTVQEFANKLRTFITDNAAAVEASHTGMRQEVLLHRQPSSGARTKSLAEAIEDLEEIVLKGKAAIRRAKSLTALLAKTTTGGTEADQATYKKALSRPEVLAELAALNSKINTHIAPLKPRIHIVSAFYGDIRRRARRNRRCNALQILRQECQRKPSCEPVTAAEVFTDKLCGFDPVPFADDRIKGLRIAYACISADKAFWEELEEDPRLREDDPPIKYAVLRVKGKKISCESPVP